MTSGNSKIVRVVPLAIRPFLLTDTSNLSGIGSCGISEPLANTIYPSPSNCFPASFSTFGSEKKLPGTFSTGAFLSEVRSVFVMWTGTIHTKVQNGILKIATLPRFLQVGGFILFDDSTDSVFGLMPEVLATGRYRLVARNPNHLFQKMQIWLIKTSGGD